MIMTKLALASILGAAAGVFAAPAAAPVPTAPAKLEDRATTCTFSGSGGAAAAIKSKASCATIVLSALAVPSGTTLDLTKLNKGTTVIFEGTTTFGYKEWDGPLLSISGTSLTVKGASGAVLDGQGSKYWDTKGGNGGKTKPKFFYAHDMIDSTISSIKVINSPVQVFSIDGSDHLTLDSITIDNSAGDALSGGKALAHNTDAFDVGDSTYITINNANVQNQDDCLAVNSGTYITFTGGTCSGGHGLSIGSVGGRSDNTVENVYIYNNIIKNSANGVRIKTVSGETGTVKNVTYKDITLSGITDYGVVIEQDYENGSPTGIPTSGVPVTDLTLSGVTGSVASDATEVYILCASCSSWTWSGVSVTGGKKSSKCKGIPSGAAC
ncbi:hypothetical protein AAFC00_004303 [Neodothiora populina]|uniref:endo-polygalacturonase n=1 Tax=Neodothiora populina TaxID=2781224 RepID=A0ABR3PKD1_9PEZI